MKSLSCFADSWNVSELTIKLKTLKNLQESNKNVLSIYKECSWNFCKRIQSCIVGISHFVLYAEWNCLKDFDSWHKIPFEAVSFQWIKSLNELLSSVTIVFIRLQHSMCQRLTQSCKNARADFRGADVFRNRYLSVLTNAIQMTRRSFKNSEV